MTAHSVILFACIVLAALGVFALFSRWILNNPRGDVESGLAWRAAQLYSRLIHRLTIVGSPPAKDPGPLLIIANHTAGLDPVLIQAACPCFVRFVMAKDMRAPSLEWAWNFTQIICVDRHSGGSDGLRYAIAHLKAGGVLGLFPEGRIERPPRTLLPFGPGVGLIIKRTRATVLPILITGTPETPTAWGSLTRRSRSTLTFGQSIDYSTTTLTPQAIADDLRRRYAEWTNWPLSESSLTPPAHAAQRPG